MDQGDHLQALRALPWERLPARLAREAVREELEKQKAEMMKPEMAVAA